MASYQSRGRDPLFDSDTQAILEKRARELVGLALIALGTAVALMLSSYVPDDPSWLAATSAPAQNLLGRMGASIASPMMVIAGLGAWGVAAALVVWGGRFVLHLGSERAMGRAVFVPIGVALLSVYLSTHVPGPGWGQSFGLGGLFGDTALGTLLGVLGVGGPIGMKLASAGIMAATLAVGGYVLGFTRAEVAAIGGWLTRGTIVTYAGLVSVLGLGRNGMAAGARAAAGRIAHARQRRAEPPLTRPVPEDAAAAVASRPGLLARLIGRLHRAPAEAVEREFIPEVEMAESADDRLSARISDAIRLRGRPRPALTVADRIEPEIRPAGPAPLFAAEPDATLIDREGTDAAYVPLEDDLEPDPDDAEWAFGGRTSAPGRDREGLPGPQTAPAIRREAPSPKVQTIAAAPEAGTGAARARPRPDPVRPEAEEADYEYPPLTLLADPRTVQRHVLSDEALEENARMLEAVLEDYGVKGEIVSVRPGPVVTMYELEPAPGLKASRVIGLADDIARSMSALSARVSTVPGRSVIGIELPNESREMCVLREILSSRAFDDANRKLPLALGKDIGGDPVVANLAKMPHLLIAGTTGSGKSVAINTMILSLLYKLTPEECRLIMIDPKMLELSVYDGIPHLLSPVVTDPKKAVVALKWVVGEMEDRYRKMSKMGVRNIEGYNSRVHDALSKGEMFERTVQTGFDDETGEPVFETEEMQPEVLPFIVVVVDEMADLMMVAGKEIEACIQRLAQMARASGIHLIMATQRPSVDVITGTIKANFPTRISFQVTSKIDSRTILGEQGAEQLLGMGDMLYMAGGSRITRVHGPFCSDEEVEDVVSHLKSFGPPDYKSGVVEGPAEDKTSDIDAVLGLAGGSGGPEGDEELYDKAVAIVIKDRKCSTSYIQRKLGIGYNKAARLVEAMEDEGVVSSANHVGKREILVPEQA